MKCEIPLLGSGSGEEAEEIEVKKEKAESERVSNNSGRKDWMKVLNVDRVGRLR